MNLSFFLLAASVLNAADPPAAKDESKPALREGANVPGPFHPYNLNGKFGPHKEGDKEVEGRYHCPVSEQAEDPMILVFTRDLAVGDKLKTLLKKIDTATAKNQNIRLAAAIVFLDKDLPEVVGATDANENRRLDQAADIRKKLAGMFEEKNKFTKQNLVVVCLSCDADLKKYELNQNEKLTVVLYTKLKIKAVYRLADDLDDAHIDAIMTDVADKLGATRK